MTPSLRLPGRTSTLLAAALLTGCASSAVRSTPAPSDWSLAEQALTSGRWQAAQAPLARLLQQDLRNGQLQFLHAFTEEAIAEQSAAGDRAHGVEGDDGAPAAAPGVRTGIPPFFRTPRELVHELGNERGFSGAG